MILMQYDLNNEITFLYPSRGIDFYELKKMIPLAPFDDRIIMFLNSLSSELMRNPAVRLMPDVVTFAFFCRKANMLRQKKMYMPSGKRLGRGIVFHIAPSNVPVNFAYSLVCGLLGGNINVVRVPSKDFPQVDIIVKAIAKVMTLPENRGMENYIILVRYDRGGKVTDLLSSLCDVRVIWGGDQTIGNIRQSSIPPRAFDITFADRYSICVIDANNYLKEGDAVKIAENFYNDTYLFDQNACSAPHLVIWKGKNQIVKEAKKIFWNALYEVVRQKYVLADILAIDKLTAFYFQSINMNIHRKDNRDNLLWRVEIEDLPVDIENYRCKAGYFTEYTTDNLECLNKIINRKYQTLAYFGFSVNELKTFIDNIHPVGIDRIVPIGKTTEFSLVWDGYNMLQALTREIVVI